MALKMHAAPQKRNDVDRVQPLSAAPFAGRKTTRGPGFVAAQILSRAARAPAPRPRPPTIAGKPSPRAELCQPASGACGFESAEVRECVSALDSVWGAGSGVGALTRLASGSPPSPTSGRGDMAVGAEGERG